MMGENNPGIEHTPLVQCLEHSYNNYPEPQLAAHSYDQRMRAVETNEAYGTKLHAEKY